MISGAFVCYARRVAVNICINCSFEKYTTIIYSKSRQQDLQRGYENLLNASLVECQKNKRTIRCFKSKFHKNATFHDVLSMHVDRQTDRQTDT